MQIIYNELGNIKLNKSGLSLALGTFDGMHRGHAMLLNKLIEIAKGKDLNTLVYTFDNQPLNVLLGDIKTKFIMTLEEREEAISEFPIDFLFIKHFDKQYAAMPCEKFIEHLLTFPNLKQVVIGFNFTFGKNAKGNSAILKEALEANGVEVTIIPPVMSNDTPISSTNIRIYIAQGDIEKANELLGRRYSIKNIVVPGLQIGNTLGFPTANINYDRHKIIPKKGVYITLTKVDGTDFPSLTNIGYNPTVDANNKDIKIETNLLDYKESLYGEKIRVSFLKRIRDEKTFDSVVSLKEQIAKDVLTAKEYFDLAH